MSQKIDRYHLSQPSESGKPGIEVFQQKNDGLFYFHFNDKKGAALLFSQAYQSAENRDKGVQTVKRNAPEQKRYEIKTENSQFYFVLKAGNNQEIARSRLFDSKLALDTAMEYVAGFFQEKPVAAASSAIKPPAPPAEDAELLRVKNLYDSERLANENLNKTIKNLNAQIQQLKKSQNIKRQSEAGASANPQAGKHAFRLELYQQENEPLRGRIEHLLSQEKQVFQGLDWKGIISFVAGYIRENDSESLLQEALQVKADVTGEAQKNEQALPEKIEQPVQQEAPQQKLEFLKVAPSFLQLVPEEEPKIATFSKDGNQPKTYFRVGEEIFFNLPFSDFAPDVQVDVIVQSLAANAGQPGRKIRAGKSGQKAYIGGLWQPGLYRLFMDARVRSDEKQVRTGNAMVQVY